jgi:hypothetical protein
MRGLIRNFDEYLAKRKGIIAYSSEPEVYTRISLGKAGWEIPLPTGSIPIGSQVIELHFWNQYLPVFPPSGPDFRWAVKFTQGVRHSFRLLAKYIHQNAVLDDAKAVGGVTILFRVGLGMVEEKVFQNFGFSTFPYHRPMGRFGEAIENLYTLSLMWAYNPGTLKGRKFREFARSEFWMSRHLFLQLYS